MTIQFSNIDYDITLKDSRKIALIMRSIIFEQKMRVGDISVVFCSDEKILEINRTYLQHDYYTDIITFDYCEGRVVSGDLVISVERVGDNSATYGVSFFNELCRVIFHGVLHLIGKKDGTEEEKADMRAAEDKYLEQLAITLKESNLLEIE